MPVKKKITKSRYEQGEKQPLVSKMTDLVLPDALKERAINSMYPYGYNIEPRNYLESFFNPASKEGPVQLNMNSAQHRNRYDSLRMYAGLPQDYNTFGKSEYRPGEGGDPNDVYYKFNDPASSSKYKDLAAKYGLLGMEPGSNINFSDGAYGNSVMNTGTLGYGKDDKGRYISYYDKWDLAGKDKMPIAKNTFGRSFNIYDRMYLSDDEFNKLKGKYKTAENPTLTNSEMYDGKQGNIGDVISNRLSGIANNVGGNVGQSDNYMAGYARRKVADVTGQALGGGIDYGNGGTIAMNAAQGAASGAAAGLAVLPPWGAIVGGAIGGAAALVKGIAGNNAENAAQAEALKNTTIQNRQSEFIPGTMIPTFDRAFGGVLSEYYTPASRPIHNNYGLGGDIAKINEKHNMGWFFANGGYFQDPAWYSSNALKYANGGELKAGGRMPEGVATFAEAKEFQKLYPEEMEFGTKTEWEHTDNKKLAMRIAADHIKDSLKMNNGAPPDYYKKLQAAGISDELNKLPLMTMQNGGILSASKAAEMLKDGKVYGKPLSDTQRRYFGHIANQANGGMIYRNGGPTIQEPTVNSNVIATRDTRPETWDSRKAVSAKKASDFYNPYRRGVEVIDSLRNVANPYLDRAIARDGQGASLNSAGLQNAFTQNSNPQQGQKGLDMWNQYLPILQQQNPSMVNQTVGQNEIGVTNPGNVLYGNRLKNQQWNNASLPRTLKELSADGKTVIRETPQEPIYAYPKGSPMPPSVINNFVQPRGFAFGGGVAGGGITGTGRIIDTHGTSGNNDNGTDNREKILTEYNTGGTHEENRYGGIQLGGKGRVESGEFRFDDPETGESYIFSNRY